VVWLIKHKKLEKESATKPPHEDDNIQHIVADSGPTIASEIQTYQNKAESLHNSLPVAGFATHLRIFPRSYAFSYAHMYRNYIHRA